MLPGNTGAPNQVLIMIPLKLQVSEDQRSEMSKLMRQPHIENNWSLQRHVGASGLTWFKQERCHTSSYTIDGMMMA